MKVTARFWLFLAVFQVVFGLVVFSATRAYYQQPETTVQVNSGASAAMDSLTQYQKMMASSPPSASDPASYSRQGDNYFGLKEYDQAALNYAKVVELDPKNVEAFNNLGLSLHYAWRSTEAVESLKRGAQAVAGDERSGLTLGFVRAAMGRKQDALQALQQAVDAGPDTPIAEEAKQMLGRLQ
ncbi:MAG: hypothetical protein DRQ37_06735 [Gammaproteobacteria bacterium]|nr:MAG: hypothetical protein DRQ37_06735 [Gammaproteobacteria bacterium]